MTQPKGRAYEMDLCTELYERTGGTILPIPAGYSGNHNIPSADIVIDDGQKVHAIELKKTSADRKSLYYDPEDTERDDLNQLLEFARDYPRTVCPYFGVRFDRRQLILAKFWLGAPNDMIALRSAVNTTPVDVRLTAAGNISVHKPDTETWPSASSGSDVEYILDTIGY